MAVNIVNTLGAGSGIDIQALAESLVEAERAPRQALIEDRIAQTEARISGYGAIKYALTELKTAFAALNDASDFASLQSVVSQPTALAVSTTASAVAGRHEVQISQVATATRRASTGFAARDTALNPDASGDGQSFSLSLSINGADPVSLSVDTATPAGVVAAINGWGQGLTARLMDTGDATAPWTIVVTGETGASQDFVLQGRDASGATVAGLAFGSDWVDAWGDPVLDGAGDPVTDGSRLATAANAQFTVDGLALERSSNTVSDVLDGVTFELYAETTGTARLELNRDGTGITAAFQALVTAYNDFDNALDVLGDRSSDVEGYGGALASDSVLERVRSQVRQMLTRTSDSPGSTLTAARDVGISLDRYGQLTLDTAQLDWALQNHFDEVVTLFTADTNNQSIYSVAPAGLAGQAVVDLDKMLRSTGVLASQTDSANTELLGYQDRLEALDVRMQAVLTRYLQQFSVMDSIVGSSSSLREGLKSTYDGLMAMYTQN